MKSMTKMGVSALLSICLLIGLSSCHKDDPDYSNVTPPTVTATYNIGGKINSISGTPIQGVKVTVKMGSETFTVTTNAKGEYSFENLKKGTYTLTAEASGKLTEEYQVIIGDEQTNIQVLNICMPNAGQSATIVSGEEKVVTTKTETFTNNPTAEVTIVSTVPAGTVNKNATLIFTPVYTIEEAVSSRAASAVEIMASGIKISCSDASVTLQKTIVMELSLPAGVAENSIVKKYNNSNRQWTTVASQKQGTKVTFEADALASYALFISLQEDSSTPGSTPTVPLTFSQSLFDNLYGSKDTKVEHVTYTCKSGSVITTQGNESTAFLKELLAKRLKGTTATDVTGNYFINATLPVGTALTVSGTQEVNTITYTIGGASVTGKVYGNVKINIKTENRQHNGGSN